MTGLSVSYHSKVKTADVSTETPTTDNTPVRDVIGVGKLHVTVDVFSATLFLSRIVPPTMRDLHIRLPLESKPLMVISALVFRVVRSITIVIFFTKVLTVTFILYSPGLTFCLGTAVMLSPGLKGAVAKSNKMSTTGFTMFAS